MYVVSQRDTALILVKKILIIVLGFKVLVEWVAWCVGAIFLFLILDLVTPPPRPS